MRPAVGVGTRECVSCRLGKLAAHSIRQRVREIVAIRVGRIFDLQLVDPLGENFEYTAEASLDVTAAILIQDHDHQQLVTESLAGDASRLTRVRSWQEMRREGKWVPLIVGECAAGKRRSISPKDIRLKFGYREMITAFLQSEPVQAAQEQLIARRGRLALQRSTCWARAMQRERPTFREFLFFFDYLIQNGDSFTKDGSLQNVAARMQVPNDTNFGKNGQARLKMIQLNEWLEADFKHMRRQTRDHGDYAKQNAIIWSRRFTEGKVTGDEIKLAYVGLLRAMLGNNEWAYAAMNRRGTIAFGTGIVNGRHLDGMEMQKVLNGGDIEQRALTGTICP